MLVAGKLLSQSFHANSNTRLHPSEWTSGVAAGGTAVLMLRKNWSDTAAALVNVKEVRAFLNSSAVGQVLEWTDLPPPPPPPAGTTCALSRCIGIDSAAVKYATGKIYKDDPAQVCAKECAPLADYEWLANVQAGKWATNNSEPLKPGVRVYAGASTWLKKSTEESGGLRTAGEKLHAPLGDPCIVVNATLFDGYLLCIHHTHTQTKGHVSVAAAKSDDVDAVAARVVAPPKIQDRNGQPVLLAPCEPSSLYQQYKLAPSSLNGTLYFQSADGSRSATWSGSSTRSCQDAADAARASRRTATCWSHSG